MKVSSKVKANIFNSIDRSIYKHVRHLCSLKVGNISSLICVFKLSSLIQKMNCGRQKL